MFNRSRKPLIMIMAVSILLLGSTLYAGPNLITNGSFETGPDITPKSSYGVGYVHLSDSDASTAITGWTIIDNIDYMGDAWAAEDLDRSLDLNGYNPGGIKQTFATNNVGEKYIVTFWLGGSEADPIIKTLDVSATGNPTQSYSFDTAGHTFVSMGWTQETYTFTATSAHTTLSFMSTSGSSGFGPALDNVSVTAVPEPSALLLLGFGFFGLAGQRRRFTK
jgi:choice-of-anchor C domain-containing protein